MVGPKQKTTRDIVKELRRGRDWEANSRLLFERYYDQVFRFFQRKGLLPEDCHDLTQDVFMAVFKGIERLRQEAQFQSWMFRIARNVYANELERRKAKKRDVIEVPLEGVPEQANATSSSGWQSADSDTSPINSMLDREKQQKLSEALETLPAQMRRCVHLRVVKGLTHAEIAAVLGISLNTVKAHIHKARKTLKERLGKYLMGIFI